MITADGSGDELITLEGLKEYQVRPPSVVDAQDSRQLTKYYSQINSLTADVWCWQILIREKRSSEYLFKQFTDDIRCSEKCELLSLTKCSSVLVAQLFNLSTYLFCRPKTYLGSFQTPTTFRKNS